MRGSVVARGGKAAIPGRGRYDPGEIDADVQLGQERQDVGLELQKSRGHIGVGDLQNEPVPSIGHYTEVLIALAR